MSEFDQVIKAEAEGLELRFRCSEEKDYPKLEGGIPCYQAGKVAPTGRYLVSIDLSETKKGSLASNSVSVTLPGGAKMEVGEGWVMAETRDGYRFYNEYGHCGKEKE